MAEREKKGVGVIVMADPIFSVQDERVKSQNLGAGSKGEVSKGFPVMKINTESGRQVMVKLRRVAQSGELARKVKDLYKDRCEIYQGSGCSKGLFFRDIANGSKNYRAMIFATHGFAMNQIPGIMEPALALTMYPKGTDGMLTMSEVAASRVKTDVTALTACQTGMGARLAGEGVMSMGRAFRIAGAKSVIVSLWAVFESSSVELTDEFFRRLKSGATKREAMIAAREKVRASGFEHPFFWSAFILVGDDQ
jgi:hypothetical protein